MVEDHVGFSVHFRYEVTSPDSLDSSHLKMCSALSVPSPEGVVLVELRTAAEQYLVNPYVEDSAILEWFRPFFAAAQSVFDDQLTGLSMTLNGMSGVTTPMLTHYVLSFSSSSDELPRVSMRRDDEQDWKHITGLQGFPESSPVFTELIELANDIDLELRVKKWRQA